MSINDFIDKTTSGDSIEIIDTIPNGSIDLCISNIITYKHASSYYRSEFNIKIINNFDANITTCNKMLGGNMFGGGNNPIYWYDYILPKLKTDSVFITNCTDLSNTLVGNKLSEYGFNKINFYYPCQPPSLEVTKIVVAEKGVPKTRGEQYKPVIPNNEPTQKHWFNHKKYLSKFFSISSKCFTFDDEYKPIPRNMTQEKVLEFVRLCAKVEGNIEPELAYSLIQYYTIDDSIWIDPDGELIISSPIENTHKITIKNVTVKPSIIIC